MIAASVIPLVMDTAKILSLDVSNRDTAIQKALEEVILVLIGTRICSSDS